MTKLTRQIVLAAFMSASIALFATDNVGWKGEGEDGLWANTANWVLTSDKATNPSDITSLGNAEVFNDYGLSGDVAITLDASTSIGGYFSDYYKGGKVTLGSTSTANVLSFTGYMGIGDYANLVLDTVGLSAGGLTLPSVGSALGTLTITDSAATFSGNADIAKQGPGTLLVNGTSAVAINGTAYVGNNAGNSSTGTVTVAGNATLTINKMMLGHNSAGIVNVDENGYFKTTGDVIIGDEGAAGEGTINVNGGVCEFNYIYVGQKSGTKGIVNLNGGTLLATQFTDYNGLSGSNEIHLNGGVLGAKSAQTIFANAYKLYVGGNFCISNDVDITIAPAIDTGDYVITKKGSGVLTFSGTLKGKVIVENGSVATLGDASGAAIVPKPMLWADFNGTTGSQIGSTQENWWGNASEPDISSSYIGSGEGATSAIKISSAVVPYYKGTYGQQKQDGDNGWSVALNVCSVEETDRLLFSVGYRNAETPYTWGLVSDGSDKLKFCQWATGTDWTVVSSGEFDVPEAAKRFHEIVLVHGADTTNTTDSIIAYVDGVEAARGNWYTHVVGEGKSNGTGNNITVGGMAKWESYSDEAYGNGFKRGDGVAVNDLRFFNSALTAAQVAALSTSSTLVAWPEMTTVADGGTYTLTGAETWTDKLLKLEAGATLAMPTTGSLTLAQSLYGLGNLLVLPSTGKVTIKLSDAASQAAGQAYTLIDDVADLDLSKFTLDKSGVAALNASLKILDGNLMCRLANKGMVIQIAGDDVELDDDSEFSTWLANNSVVPAEVDGLLAANARGLSPLAAYLLGYDEYSASTAAPTVTNAMEYATFHFDYNLGGKTRRTLENATLEYSAIATNDATAAVEDWETVAPPHINPGVELYIGNAGLYNKLTANLVGEKSPTFSYDHTATSVYQWSVESTPPVDTDRKVGRAFLWIPETCQTLRGVVVGQQNMIEEPIFESPVFRKELAAADLGIIFIAPIQAGVTNVDSRIVTWMEGLLDSLATASGYSELTTCKLAFIGHSAMASWPYMQCAAMNDRAFAGVSLKGAEANMSASDGHASDAVGAALEGIPFILVDGEYEDAEGRAQRSRTFCNKYPDIPFSFLGEDGAGHFDWSDELAHYLGVYFRKAIDFRENSGTVASGWLMERWKKSSAPSCRPAPKDTYIGDKEQSYWYFDEEMVRETEYLQERFRQQAKTPLLNYVVKGAAMEQKMTHMQVLLPFNGRTTFSFQPTFYDTVVDSEAGRFANWTGLSVGDTCPHPSSTATIYVQKMSGGCCQTAKDEYKLRFNRGWPMPEGNESTYIDFQMVFPGSSEYQRVVQQARMTIKQSSYDSGVCGYYVREGAAMIDPETGALTKLPLPPKADAANHKITYVKWNWGSTNEVNVVDYSSL